MEQTSLTATKQPNTYKITLRKIAKAAAAEVRVHKKLAIISFVLYGVAMLLFVFNADFYDYRYSTYYTNKPAEFEPSNWGIFFAVAGVCITLFAVLNVFRDTSSQQLCDVGMALPIKASERFFSKLMCLFLIQIAPFTVSVLGGNGIAVLIGTVRYGKLAEITSDFVFTMFFAGLAAILFITAVTVLTACCCGTIAESAYFSFIMMFIINVFPLAFVTNILNRSAGFSDGWFFQLFDSNSPNIDLKYWGFLYLANDEMKGVIIHAAVGCVISVAVILLSGLIYKKRDARSVGTPISSKLFFEIMMAGGCVTIFSLSFMTREVLWGILIAGVAYFIISVIVSRAKINALSFVKWIAKFAVTTAVFTGIVIGAIKTGGFGYYTLRPDKMYLDGASFNIRIYDWNDERFATKELTEEQADELMKLCKKYIGKGVAKVNPFKAIFNTYDLTYVWVEAGSYNKFLNKPFPGFMFNRYYGNDLIEGYILQYNQDIAVSGDIVNEFANELRKLDYVIEIHREPIVYTEVYPKEYD